MISLWMNRAIKLERQVAALKIGNGFDEDTQQGPLINETAVKKVL